MVTSDAMYTVVLLIHSWVRWIALVAGFGATLAVASDSQLKPNARAERWGLILLMALDIQLLLGLALYLALSPFTAAARLDFSAAMRNPDLRFWAVEHISSMLIAVVVVHVGRVLARKATTPESRKTRLVVCYGIATFLMLFGTPWPGMASGRPLFRF